MLKADRFARILDHVARAGSADVHQLAELLDVSGATIRRDLQALDEQGLLRRTHGGAVTGTVNLELPLRHRAGRRQEEKRRIAEAAAELVPDGAVVGLTGGSTVSELAHVLAERVGGGQGSLTVVTNAVNIAADLIVRPEIRLVVIGGQARSASYELVGPAADQHLARYRLDFAFIGVDGLSAAAGCTTHDEMEAHTDRSFLRVAAHRVVLADASKLGRATFASICPLEEIDTLVTDAAPAEPEHAALAAADVRVRGVDGDTT
ncbi:DeoR/GlpR family DNA-binding transcription regulator [Streptacidiphilus neutrinimicus]|uniref:DeoR/GlpR family DNA-binding transcription regulator n=1 Tax=Streptacidiphilus neutrinimicus TaxID=105420 RepID=UPI0005AAE372|nr:DeoR/GlpR family DNA-binding transcription regulator [Streptacidiphilus neutrinimicus]